MALVIAPLLLILSVPARSAATTAKTKTTKRATTRRAAATRRPVACAVLPELDVASLLGHPVHAQQGETAGDCVYVRPDRVTTSQDSWSTVQIWFVVEGSPANANFPFLSGLLAPTSQIAAPATRNHRRLTPVTEATGISDQASVSARMPGWTIVTS